MAAGGVFPMGEGDRLPPALAAVAEPAEIIMRTTLTVQEAS
jgi:hypothetical protein